MATTSLPPEPYCGYVVLDQPQRVRHAGVVRLVFDKAALRSDCLVQGFATLLSIPLPNIPLPFPDSKLWLQLAGECSAEEWAKVFREGGSGVSFSPSEPALG